MRLVEVLGDIFTAHHFFHSNVSYSSYKNWAPCQPPGISTYIRFCSSMPFGAGRRVCPGEVFAKSRLFLLVTTMLQNFDFKLCDESIESDVRCYRNEVVLEVPEHVPMLFTTR